MQTPEQFLEELKNYLQSNIGHPRKTGISIFAEILFNKIEQYQTQQKQVEDDNR